MAQLAGLGRGLLGQLAQLSMPRWGFGLGAILLAISGLFGGLDTVEPEPAALNTVIDAGPWKVTITGARLTGELPPMYLSDKKNYFIVVLATVEITADHTWRFPRETVQLAQTKGIKTEPSETLAGYSVHYNDGMVLLRDAVRIDQLNPGMPEKLAYFWEFDSSVEIPKEVKVYVGFREFREDSLTSHMNWMDNSWNSQAVMVPVIDRRAQSAASS